MQDAVNVEVHRHDNLTEDERRRLNRAIREIPDRIINHIEKNCIPADLQNKVKIKIT